MSAADNESALIAETEGLAGDFAVLARALQAQDSLPRTLDVICALAVQAIPGAEHAGITVRRGKDFTTPAASDDVPRVVDKIQYETGQGPCVDAIRQHETLSFDDVTTESSWPAFTVRLSAETNIRSMLSYRLFLREDTLGALNLYATRPNAFPENARSLGKTFAAHAAVAMQAARTEGQVVQLEQALVNSRRIGAAIGILMSRHVLTEEDAFTRLRVASQHTHRKLRDIADDVLLIGDLPS
ncbi:MAG: hypothetical protein JWN95_1332 [Frankiales bacterium]|nr:hypothetical protein [Frankiales bacterium]